MVPKLLLLCSLLIVNSAFAQQIIYPDNVVPSDTPRIFGYGVFSDGFGNRDFTISPDGDEIFFTLQYFRFTSSTILRVHKVNGQWSKPEVAPFSGTYRDLEASFSPDGKTIYFSSDRPINEKDTTDDFDIWKVVKLDNGNWNEPEHLGFTANGSKDEFYPSVSKNGNLYFTVEADFGQGKEDIVMCHYNNGAYESPVSLPKTVNSEGYEFNAFVAPDERFIIFTSYGRENDLGGGDLYISVKDENNNWQPAKHLPAPVNSQALDYCPYVSPEGKLFFFTSSRMNAVFRNKTKKTYSELKNLINSAGNGLDDIYWMKFDDGWLQ